MRHYFNNIAKNSSVYFLGNIITRGFGFILLPVLTRFLSPDEFGIYNFVEIIVTLCIPLFSLSLLGAVSRFYFDYEEKSKEQKQYLGRIFIFINLVSIVLMSFFIGFGRSMIESLFSGMDFYPYAVLAFIIAVFRISYRYKLTIYRCQQASLAYSIFNSSFFIFKLLTLLYVLMVMRKGLIGIVWADLVVSLLFALISLYLMRDEIRADFDFRQLMPSIKYSLPIIPHDISGYILSTIDRVFIAGLLTMADVGIYSLAVKISLIMVFLMEAVRMTYNPLFFQKAINDAEESKPFFSKVFTHTMLLFVFVGLNIIVFSPEIISIFSTPEYRHAGAILPLIIISQVLQGIYYMTVIPLFLDKKNTYLVTVSTLISSVINIFLNIWLIKKYQLSGAAIATCISIGLSALLTYIFSQRIFPIRYEYKRIAYIFLLFIACIVINYWIILPIHSLVFAIGSKVVLIGLFLYSLLLLKFFTAGELEYAQFVLAKIGIGKKTLS